MRRTQWLGAAAVIVAVVGAAGTAVAMTGGGDREAQEGTRRAQLENLARLTGEPINDAEIDAQLAEESLYPQEPQEIDLVDGTGEDHIVNVVDEDEQ